MTVDVTVSIEQGQLRGKTVTDYLGGKFHSFLGIPYGKSPVGELRFRAPQPAEGWSGVRDATRDGNPCPSLDMFFLYYTGKEEDCLNLNVHTKEIPTSDNTTKLKPVMVWIHGGAFLYGSNLNELFGPEYLMSEDIVLVSINYRLGVLGFLSLEDPSLKVPGNAGLKDMVLALKWVQKNISRFGGDPNNVTIFGESAGAASVHYLTLSPTTKGLFHKAIIQSGCSINAWAKGQKGVKEIARALKYRNEGNEKEILEKLQKENIKTLIHATYKVPDPFTPSQVRPFGPVVESESSESPFLTEDPKEILRKGNYNKVPIIMGFTTREGMLFEIVRKTRPNVYLPHDLETEIPYDLNLAKGSEESKQVAAKMKQFYFKDKEISDAVIDNVYTLKTDNQFLYGIYKTISSHVEHSSEPVYFYKMTLDGPLNYFKRFCSANHIKTLFVTLLLARITGNIQPLKKLFLSMGKLVSSVPMNGVCHADDLGYLFTTFCMPIIRPGSKEEIFVKRFVKLWTNFAKTGKPIPENDEILNTTWPATSKDFELLNIGDQLKPEKFSEIDRMQFWDEIYSSSGCK